MAFGKYTIKDHTLIELETIKNSLQTDDEFKSMWNVIEGKNEIFATDSNNKSTQSNEQVSPTPPEMIMPSTQFFFTQAAPHFNKFVADNESSDISDIVECLRENLEFNSGKFNIAYVDNLTNEDLFKVVNDLKDKLSLKGVYNLCCSMNNMNIDQRLKFFEILCSGILVPKIIELEEPSRLISLAIKDCVEKFPNDIQNSIFIPLINTDLKDCTVINTIINNIESQQKSVLIMNFIITIKELREWHILILQNLLSIKLDETIKDKLIKLLYDNSFQFSKNKYFGKLVLSFLKTNIPFNNEQKLLLQEIASVNESLFKRPMESMLNNV